MKLILIRHGDAGAYTLPDNERNLSALGKAQAKQTANWLKDKAYLKGRVQFVSSPYVRAYQTLAVLLSELKLDGLAEGVKQAPTISYDGITPNGDPKHALAGLAKLADDELITQDGCLVVVCHMNIIARMASLLTHNHDGGFDLAQAKVYELPFIQIAQAVQIDAFCPPLSKA